MEKTEFTMFDYDPVSQRDEYLKQDAESVERNFPGKAAWVHKPDNVFYFRATYDEIEYLIVVVRQYRDGGRLYICSASPVGYIFKLELQSFQVDKSAFDECSEAESDSHAMEMAEKGTSIAHGELMMFARRQGEHATH